MEVHSPRVLQHEWVGQKQPDIETAIQRVRANTVAYGRQA